MEEQIVIKRAIEMNDDIREKMAELCIEAFYDVFKVISKDKIK